MKGVGVEYRSLSSIICVMSKYTGIIGLAILVALMPHLGFPSVFDSVFYTVAGLIIATSLYSSKKTYCSSCKRLINNEQKGTEEHLNTSEGVG